MKNLKRKLKERSAIWIQIIKELLSTNGKLSLNKVLVVVFALVVLTSWIGSLFFNRTLPEFIFTQLVLLLQHLADNP